jgi:hypothetical protein
MAKVFRVIGQVAGVVATVAAFVPGGQAIAAIATAVSAVSSISAQVLAKPPAAKGQITERIIGANNPLPYLMGRSYSGGVQVHDIGYGGEVNGVDNPYRFLVTVHSCAGPVEQIESTLANFSPVTFSGSAAAGYYNDYWWRDTQLGARPEADALAPNFAGAPRWGASYKLSGFCAVGHTFKWSKKGKRFAGGQLPILGEIVRGVKVYDPRLDSTYPGGSGSHRINNEATWTYSRNPALHALTYAYGRYVNGVKVFGVDLGSASIDLSSAVAWANVCDANGWNCDGTIYEPGNKWENLKRICQSGGAQPVLVGGVLRFDYQAPRTALATITRDDLASGPLRDSLGRGWKDRHNTIVPRYRSENHQWEYVQSDAVSVPAFVTEDGEIKRDEIQYDLVTNKDQAAELATYDLYQRRELGPINLPLKPHFRSYDPGDCFTLSADLSPTGAPIKVVMRSRSVDVAGGIINCTFETENDTKHVDALGALGTEPTSFTFPTAEELDDTAAINTSAANTIYSDGLTSVEELRPAEAGGTRNVARGTYDAGTTYTRGDEVIFSGSTYRLIVDTSTGNAPPDVARWALIAQAGSGPAGADGLPGISVLVSNEAHVVATAQDGSGGDYSGAGGQMLLLRGDVLLSPTFSIAAASPATSWITINATTGVYTVTDPGVDLATATLRATWAGVNYDRTYTLAKSKQGVTGPRLALAASAQAFTFTDGAANPSGQSITIEALLNNLSGTATFTTTPSVTLTGTGNTRTLTVANFGANRQVTIEATLGGITDRITLVRVDRDVVAPANANRLPFSRMEGGIGWTTINSTATSQTAFAPNNFGGTRTYIVSNVTFGAAGQQHFSGNNTVIPVVPGERLSVSCRLDVSPVSGPATSFWQLGAEFVGPSGVVGFSVIANGTTTPPDPVAAAALAAFVTVPAGANRVNFRLRVDGAGAGVMRVAFLEPMIATAAAGQTVHPGYVPGPNAQDGALPNSLITVSGGVLSGIGTAGVFVDNTRAALQGLASARPASGQFIGQEYHATDTREISQWDGFNWRMSADITAAAQITTSQPAPFQVQANSEGVTTTDLSTQTRSITLFRGGVAQTSGVTVGTPVPTTGITVASATVSSGIVTLTLATANASGSVTVPVIFGGVTYNVTIAVTRTLAAPVAGGTGSQPFVAQNWVNVNSTTYAQVTPAGATVLSTSGGQLAFSYSAQYNGGQAQCKCQYSLNGTTWLDVAGTEVTGTGAITVPGEEEPGDISRSQVTQSGLDASTLYYVRLVARRTSGSGTLSWLSPVFTAKQP